MSKLLVRTTWLPLKSGREPYSVSITNKIEVDIHSSALLLIDIWNKHENDTWFELAYNNVTTKILPVLNVFRETQCCILHAPANRKEHSSLTPTTKFEYFVKDVDDIKVLMSLHKFKTIFVCGYASNICIQFRPCGLHNLRTHIGKNIIFIRDASIAIETGAKSNAHEMATNTIELALRIPTTTVDDILNWYRS